jgi:hypothetical protein
MLASDIDSFQLFFDVTTKTRPGTKVTFLLPHFGHCGFTASCSEMVSLRSKRFPLSRNDIDRSAWTSSAQRDARPWAVFGTIKKVGDHSETDPAHGEYHASQQH